MKINLFIVGLFLFSIITCKQDPDPSRAILKKSFEKCQSIRNGYYEMTKYVKWKGEVDTSKYTFNCYFKKLKNNNIYCSAFRYREFCKGYISDVLFTGDTFVSSSNADSTAVIMDGSRWAKEIDPKINRQSFRTFYTPLMDDNSAPLPGNDYFNQENLNSKYIGEENVNGTLCYHIKTDKIQGIKTDVKRSNLRIEYNFWISCEDFIPIQYSIANVDLMYIGCSYQYEKSVLGKYELNNLKDDKILTLSTVPDHNKTRDYVFSKISEGTIAPGWELRSLSGEKVNLRSLEGHLVLIDFFYKSCRPCIESMPKLQALSEKYKSLGLRVVGIDPVDANESDIPEFLTKLGVTYTVLMGDRNTVDDYQLSGFPTIFLLDKLGKIILIKPGYDNDFEQILENSIKKNL